MGKKKKKGRFSHPSLWYTVRCRYYDDDGDEIVEHPRGPCKFAHPGFEAWYYAERREMAEPDVEYSDEDEESVGGYSGSYGGHYDDDDEEEEEEEEAEEQEPWYTVRCRYFDDDGNAVDDCPRDTYQCMFAHPDQDEWWSAVRRQGPRPPPPPPRRRADRAPRPDRPRADSRYGAAPPPLRFHPDDDEPPPRRATQPSYAQHHQERRPTELPPYIALPRPNPNIYTAVAYRPPPPLYQPPMPASTSQPIASTSTLPAASRPVRRDPPPVTPPRPTGQAFYPETPRKPTYLPDTDTYHSPTSTIVASSSTGAASTAAVASTSTAPSSCAAPPPVNTLAITSSAKPPGKRPPRKPFKSHPRPVPYFPTPQARQNERVRSMLRALRLTLHYNATTSAYQQWRTARQADEYGHCSAAARAQIEAVSLSKKRDMETARSQMEEAVAWVGKLEADPRTRALDPGFDHEGEGRALEAYVMEVADWVEVVGMVVEEIEVEGCVREGGEVVKEEGQKEAVGAPVDDAWDQAYASLEQHLAKLEQDTTEGTRAMEEAVDGLAFDLRQAGVNMQSNIREGLERARDEHLLEPTAATCSHMDILLDASDGMRADIEAVAKQLEEDMQRFEANRQAIQQLREERERNWESVRKFERMQAECDEETRAIDALERKLASLMRESTPPASARYSVRSLEVDELESTLDGDEVVREEDSVRDESSAHDECSIAEEEDIRSEDTHSAPEDDEIDDADQEMDKVVEQDMNYPEEDELDNAEDQELESLTDDLNDLAGFPEVTPDAIPRYSPPVDTKVLPSPARGSSTLPDTSSTLPASSSTLPDSFPTRLSSPIHLSALLPLVERAVSDILENELRGVLAKVQKNASGFGPALKYQFEPLIARAQDVLQRVAEDAMSSGAGAAQTTGP